VKQHLRPTESSHPEELASFSEAAPEPQMRFDAGGQIPPVATDGIAPPTASERGFGDDVLVADASGKGGLPLGPIKLLSIEEAQKEIGRELSPGQAFPVIFSKNYVGPNGAKGVRDPLRRRVDLSCQYIYRSLSGQYVQVTGHHSERFWGKEGDTDLSCKGVDYKHQWTGNAMSLREVWMPHPRSFSPNKYADEVPEFQGLEQRIQELLKSNDAKLGNVG